MTADRDGLWVASTTRDVVRVVGEDAASFLHGQLSQDVLAIGVGGSAWSFILQPQGKVDAWVGVTRVADDELLLDVDAGFGASVLDRVNRFKLRVKADSSLVEGVGTMAVRGPGADDVVVADGAATAPVYRRRGPLTGALDVLSFQPLAPAAVLDATGAPLSVAGPAELELARIDAGVPAMGHEITDKTIPAELGQWVIDASVSFTKGCFTGQELVARIDSRGGHVPRRLHRVAVDGEVPPVGAALSVGEHEAGELTSVAATGAGAIALAFVPRAVEAPTDAVVRWDGTEAAAHIRP